MAQYFSGASDFSAPGLSSNASAFGALLDAATAIQNNKRSNRNNLLQQGIQSAGSIIQQGMKNKADGASGLNDAAFIGELSNARMASDNGASYLANADGSRFNIYESAKRTGASPEVVRASIENFSPSRMALRSNQGYKIDQDVASSSPNDPLIQESFENQTANRLGIKLQPDKVVPVEDPMPQEITQPDLMNNQPVQQEEPVDNRTPEEAYDSMFSEKLSELQNPQNTGVAPDEGVFDEAPTELPKNDFPATEAYMQAAGQQPGLSNGALANAQIDNGQSIAPSYQQDPRSMQSPVDKAARSFSLGGKTGVEPGTHLDLFQVERQELANKKQSLLNSQQDLLNKKQDYEKGQVDAFRASGDLNEIKDLANVVSRNSLSKNVLFKGSTGGDFESNIPQTAETRDYANLGASLARGDYNKYKENKMAVQDMNDKVGRFVASNDRLGQLLLSNPGKQLTIKGGEFIQDKSGGFFTPFEVLGSDANLTSQVQTLLDEMNTFRATFARAAGEKGALSRDDVIPFERILAPRAMNYNAWQAARASSIPSIGKSLYRTGIIYNESGSAQTGYRLLQEQKSLNRTLDSRVNNVGGPANNPSQGYSFAPKSQAPVLGNDLSARLKMRGVR